jgi:hypothetical protein
MNKSAKTYFITSLRRLLNEYLTVLRYNEFFTFSTVWVQDIVAIG